MNLDLGNLPRTIWVEKSEGGPVVGFVDQRLLPDDLALVRTADWREVVDAVKTLAVRGAPAIGVAGAAAVMLAAFECAADESAANLVRQGDPEAGGGFGREGARADFDRRLEEAARVITGARPTAVNLSWGVRRAVEAAQEARSAGKTAAEAAEALYGLAGALIAEDEAVNRRIGAHGAMLLREVADKRDGRGDAPEASHGIDGSSRVAAPVRRQGLNILTHCNAGSLATAFYGTALGVVYAAAEQGKIERVYADETRPVGQGARLTSWELARAGVPCTLVCDNMAASLMAKGEVDAVIVGADRIAANGDAANKIGTYGVAVLARHHGIPFYVAAPTSTIDPAIADGSGIPIEERDASEVLPVAIEGVDVWNPAFDVTPAGLITRIVTERGAFEPDKLVY